MLDIPITKMNGSGNDFILIDHRAAFLKDLSLPLLARTLCHRQEAVGADGLILIENSDQADFKWRFFNADGSEAEMCGNGGRCAARFAFVHGIAGKSLIFETLAGPIRAVVKGKRVLLQLPRPADLNLNRSLSLENQNLSLSSINTGVPHAVWMVDDLERVSVQELGRKIRFHPAFQPAGTNVNFVRIFDSSSLGIRTYERGVENETLACGTGSVASVLVAAALGVVKSPVEAKTRGGELLTISFEQNAEGDFTEVYLEGDTCLVFEGVLGPDVWEKYEKAARG